jgi:transcriptional regulator with XRE-family HTH domain
LLVKAANGDNRPLEKLVGSNVSDAIDTARLRAARERLGVQQVELADALGLPRSSIGEYERGAKAPRYPAFKRLCRALDVSADWLLGLDPQPSYRRQQPSEGLPESAEAILADFGAPSGLRDLADSKSHQTALRITAEEWAALYSLDFGDGLSREGYVGLLVLLRTASLRALRERLYPNAGKRTDRSDQPESPEAADDDDDGSEDDGGASPVPAAS